MCAEVLRLRRENLILLNRFLFGERRSESGGKGGEWILRSHKLLRSFSVDVFDLLYISMLIQIY